MDPVTYSKEWLADAGSILQSLPSVYAARLLSSEDRTQLEAIHLLAGTDRNAKQIVRDVQSALSAMYGIDIDHRIISVAQSAINPLIGDEEEEAPPKTVYVRETRPKYCGMRMEEYARGMSVTVTLEYEDTFYEGTATGTSGALWRDTVAAQATLDAVAHLPAQENAYAFMSVHELQTTTTRLCVVVVQSRADNIILTGVAPTETGSLHGVVRATLDAVNRHLLAHLPRTV